MKFKETEHIEKWDPHEFMVIPPNKQTDLIIQEIITKDNPRLGYINDLIELGANLDWINDQGNSVLHIAVHNQKNDLVKLFLKRGVDANIKDTWNETPLHWAVRHNDLPLIKILLKYGSDINALDLVGRTPLIFAVHNNNIRLVRFLLDKGADPNIQDNDNWTALFWSVRHRSIKIVKMLISSGADRNTCDEHNMTPFDVSEMRGYTEISKVLKTFKIIK
jgi:ankyrin repeat protein